MKNSSRARAAVAANPSRLFAATSLPLAALVLLALLLSGCSEGSGAAPALSAREAKELLDSRPGQVLVLDVRTPDEVARGTLPGAVVLDFYDPSFKTRLGALDRSKTILVYCHSGGRSAAAVTMMREMGFGDVRHLGGGIVEWVRERLPLITPGG